MRRTVTRYCVACALACLAVIHSGSADFQNTLTAENLTPAKDVKTQPQPRPDAGQAAAKPDKVLEREVALSLKEQEMKRLGETLEARIKQLDEARKGMEASLSQKKKDDSEKYAKMLKVYKALRPEAAAALIDKLDEDIAIEMLNRMDQKTTVKVIPFMNQARVLKWTRLNLKGG
jgi:flagellar motility protein MotE (MotC chaperone)